MSELPPDHDDAGELAAAEHALGLLEDDARSEAEARLRRDPAFAAAVEGWESRLAPLLDAIAPEAPPSALWERVARRLGSGSAADGAVILQLRHRTRVWRGVAAAAACVATVLATTLLFQARPPTAPAPLMTARLSPPGGSSPLFMAVYDPRTRVVLLAPVGAAHTPGRSPELWLLPAGGRPLALGVGAFDHPVRLASVAGLKTGGDAALAVSAEPPGGSPTGQPTGPVIATGKLSSL